MNRTILDLRGLAIHAYYSDKANLTAYVLNKDGEKVPSAEHGVSQFIDLYLNPLLQQGVAPVQIIAALEGNKGNARRRAMSPSYKEKKEQDADDPVVSEEKNKCIEGCQRLLLHLGATLVSCPYAEADDVVAHLLEKLPGHHTLYTVDQDLLAAKRDSNTIFVTDRNLGVPTERTEFKGMDLNEVGPSMVTLYKALVGDSSDNIKGVPGFGQAAFDKTVHQYGWDGMQQIAEIVASRDWATLQGAAEADPTFKPIQLILKERESAHLSWKLASLHPEWCEQNWGEKPVRLNWAKRVPLEENVRKELARYNLSDRYDEFSKYVVKRWVLDKPRLDKLKEGGEANLKRMLTDMNSSHVLAFDYETYDTLKNPNFKVAGRGKFVDVLNSVPTGVSFCFGANLNHCFYMPANHRDTANCSQEDISVLLRRTEGAQRAIHNAQFEGVVSAKALGYRFPLGNLPHDTAIMSSYSDENQEQGLKKLSKHYLNYDQINYSEVVGPDQDMRDISAEEVMRYGCDDSIVTAHLYLLFQTIMQCEQTWDFYFENERYFYEAHIDSFIKGVPVDFDRLEALAAEDAARFDELEGNLRLALASRCSSVNEQGFKNLWPEVKQYVEATYKTACVKKSKPVDEDELRKKVEKAREQTYAGCAYEEYTYRIENPLDRQVLSDVARSIGLAAIRSARPEKLQDWADSMRLQAEEQGTELTAEQYNFLSHMHYHCAGQSGPLLSFIKEKTRKDKQFWTGSELNVGSPKQMAELFYGMLGLPILIRNEADEGSARDMYDLAGAPATNDLAIVTWLVELKEDDWRREILEIVKEMKNLRQRNSLYYKPYPLWRSPQDGRLHPQFRNCSTVTRRPTGSSPNFLQISKTKDGGRIRSCIMPQSFDRPDIEEEVVVSIDWAQQEVRIAAAVSGDKNLLSCYVGDKRADVHSRAATRITNILNRREGKGPVTYEQFETIRKDGGHPEAKRLNEIRGKKGKPTVFLLIYSGSALGLSRKLVVPSELGQDIFDEFFKEFPDLAKRQQDVVEFARKHGYSQTMYGNRRHAHDILSKDGAVRAAVQRQVVNMEEQGTAADIAKMTMREWCLQDVPGKTGATLYALVYDELVASVPASKAGEYIRMVMNIMQITLPGTEVVLEAEASLGKSWGDQTECHGKSSDSDIKMLLEKADG